VAPELAVVTLASQSARRDGIAQMNKPTGELFAALQRELHLVIGQVLHRTVIGQAQAPSLKAVPMAPAAPVISTRSVRGSIMSVLPNETVADRNRLRQAAVFWVVSLASAVAGEDQLAADGIEAVMRNGVSAFSGAVLKHRQRQAALRVITVAHATADHPAMAVEGGPHYQPKA
jgi:hypothetical protein